MSALNGYQKWALGMASPETKKSRGSMLLAAALGLAGEGGEVADMVKKLMFHREGGSLDELSVDQRTRFIDEASDVLWYLALLASALDVTLEEVLAHNVEKLTRRHAGAQFNYQAYDGTQHIGVAIDPGAPGGDHTGVAIVRDGVVENQFIPPDYAASLSSLSSIERERLYYGKPAPAERAFDEARFREAERRIAHPNNGAMTAREYYEEQFGDHWTSEDQAALEASKATLPEGVVDHGKIDWTMDLTGDVESDPTDGRDEQAS